jgi:hypothetical protein
MQDLGYELRRIHIPRTWVNKANKKRRPGYRARPANTLEDKSRSANYDQSEPPVSKAAAIACGHTQCGAVYRLLNENVDGTKGVGGS